MRDRGRRSTRRKKYTCVGNGLITLDVVSNGAATVSSEYFVGGSCANVLTILSILGWKAYPSAMLKNNRATKALLKDLQKWKVRNKFLLIKKEGRTPIIVQKKKGARSHVFLLNCPTCHSQLPKHKPIAKDLLTELIKNLPKAEVFYFDRVSDSSLRLAKHFRAQGSLIFFEPSRVRNKTLFAACLKESDIVKFSHLRVRDGRIQIMRSHASLIIETLGKQGLRFACRTNGGPTRWIDQLGFDATEIKDTAGAGDWCSAGIIHKLRNARRSTLTKNNSKTIHEALRYGQALAALNCNFEGARGLMYALGKRKLNVAVDHLIKNSLNGDLREVKSKPPALRMTPCICRYMLKTISL